MDSKKVGIVTYHYHTNYGTMLQALALQEVIRKVGYYSEIIDYRHQIVLSKKEKILLRFNRLPVYCKKIDKYFVLFWNRKIEVKKRGAFVSFFERFIQKSEKTYHNITELKQDSPIYDGYIVGSDQTWNPYVSHRPEAFYLTFVENNERKGSYAPSLPVTNLDEEQRQFLKDNLSQFAYLSCREKRGAAFLSEVVNRPVAHVVDPTLLLEKEEWARFECEEVYVKEPYIFVYFLGEIKWHRRAVEVLQTMTGYRVISVPMSYLEMSNTKWDRRVVGPDGFLNLIRNASIVCTDSFHGTIFSVNYRKDFYTFEKRLNREKTSDNGRIHDVLEMLGLEDRIVRDVDDEVLGKGIDYAKIEKVIDEAKKESMDYLKKMLQKITE